MNKKFLALLTLGVMGAQAHAESTNACAWGDSFSIGVLLGGSNSTLNILNSTSVTTNNLGAQTFTPDSSSAPTGASFSDPAIMMSQPDAGYLYNGYPQGSHTASHIWPGLNLALNFRAGDAPVVFGLEVEAGFMNNQRLSIMGSGIRSFAFLNPVIDTTTGDTTAYDYGKLYGPVPQNASMVLGAASWDLALRAMFLVTKALGIFVKAGVGQFYTKLQIERAQGQVSSGDYLSDMNYATDDDPKTTLPYTNGTEGTFSVFGPISVNQTFFSLGLGLEGKVSNDWSVGVEYSMKMFPTKTFDFKNADLQSSTGVFYTIAGATPATGVEGEVTGEFNATMPDKSATLTTQLNFSHVAFFVKYHIPLSSN